MYKYKVEVFDKGEGFPFNLKLYETITVDGYCAELEARKAHPDAIIGQVTRISDYIETKSECINNVYSGENK